MVYTKTFTKDLFVSSLYEVPKMQKLISQEYSKSLKYSNHLNTKLNPNFNFSDDFFCPVFKWSDLIWQTTQIMDILDHNTDFDCHIFRPPFDNWTLWVKLLALSWW